VISRIAADAVLVAHLAFIAHVLVGGLLVLHHRMWAAFHLPAAAWGAFAELTGTLCPLTPLENSLRRSAGAAGYEGGFIEHYLIPLIYPAGLTPRAQLAIGLVVLVINVPIYALAWRRWRRERRSMTRGA
jgi:uncharacterized protein DUF2784